MPSPKLRGELSEMEAMLALMRAGYTVLTAPYTDCVRYDCVLDDGGRFLRVQIKTGKLSRDGAVIRFATASNNWHRGTKHSYVGQIELFAVFCPDNGKTYLVPVGELGTHTGTLRLVPTRNGQTADVRMADAYEVRPAGVRSDFATPRVPGRLKGRVHVPPSFFDPLPDDELRGWGQA